MRIASAITHMVFGVHNASKLHWGGTWVQAFLHKDKYVLLKPQSGCCDSHF